MRTLSLICFGLLLNATPVVAQRSGMGYGMKPVPGDTGPSNPENVRFVQKLGGQVPLDQTYFDHNNQPVTLRDLSQGKPTILVLAYYRCPKLCNQVLTAVLDSLKDLRKDDPKFTAGGPFNVIVVSVDPRESPMTIARPKRTEFLREYLGSTEDVPGWWFLSANQGQGTDVKAADKKIHELATAVGYEYSLRAREKDYLYNPETGEWVSLQGGQILEELPRNYDYQHASGIVLLTPDGRISSYLLGINYSASDLRLGLIQASGGTIGSLFERNVYAPLCYVYDDIKGHYKSTMFWLAIVGVPFVATVFYLVYRGIRSARREPQLKPGQGMLSPSNTTLGATANAQAANDSSTAT